MINLRYIVILIVSFFTSFQALCLEIKILYQIEDEIITNFDVQEEVKYIRINRDTSNLNDKELFQISLRSLIKEKIKKNEIKKYYEIDYNVEKNKDISKLLLSQLGNKLNFPSLQEFEQYLISKEIDIIKFKKKLLIDNFWNQLIVDKYINLIKIDEFKIDSQLKKLINNKSNILSFDLSEIVFLENSDKEFKLKYEEIIKSINNKGFGETAIIYSISESATSKGKIGWINETQISNVIFDEIKNLKVGDFSKPIDTSSGKIILKVNDKKNISKDFNVEEEKKKLIQYEQNRLLNQFSILYYKEIENKIYAEKL